MHVSKCRRSFPPRLESCTFAPVSTQTSSKNPLTRWRTSLTYRFWMNVQRLSFKSVNLLVTNSPQSSRAVCKKFPPFPRIQGTHIRLLSSKSDLQKNPCPKREMFRCCSFFFLCMFFFSVSFFCCQFLFSCFFGRFFRGWIHQPQVLQKKCPMM